MKKGFETEYPLLELPPSPNKVLVVVNAYNSVKTIGRTLISLRNQDCRDFVVVVHDDASTDETRAMIDKFSQANPELFFRAYRSANSFQVAKKYSKWKLIKRIESDFIAMCDGDDFWSENWISAQLRNLQQNPKAAMSISDTLCVSPEDYSNNLTEQITERTHESPRFRILPRYKFSTSSMMQSRETVNFDLMTLVDQYPQGDLLRYHIALQHGPAKHQSESICFRTPNGEWARRPPLNRTRYTLRTLLALGPNLNAPGKMRLIRPILASGVALIVKKFHKKLNSGMF